MTSGTQDRPDEIDRLLDDPDLVEALESDAFRLLLDHIPIAIVVAERPGRRERICYANRQFETLTGLRGSDVERRRWDILDFYIDEGRPERKLGDAILAEEDFLGTFRLEGDGDGAALKLVDAYSSLITDDAGELRFRLAALIDVTDRERAHREQFEQQIREKDVLLKELQHRVKNNLQLITALIRLEARHARNSASSAYFDSLAGRIESLQLLYQQLSPDEDGREIDLGAYLSQIAAAVTRTHSFGGIRLEMKVDLCPISVNVAMPVGLIVNEVLTNAFKYAFAGRDGGTIALTCECRAEGAYQVVVADDGIGMPEGVEWPAQGKLGALIVQSLKENARARLSVQSTPGEGTRVTIAFIDRAGAASE